MTASMPPAASTVDAKIGLPSRARMRSVPGVDPLGRTSRVRVVSGVSREQQLEQRLADEPGDSCEQEVSAGQSFSDPPGADVPVPLGGPLHGGLSISPPSMRRP